MAAGDSRCLGRERAVFQLSERKLIKKALKPEQMNALYIQSISQWELDRNPVTSDFIWPHGIHTKVKQLFSK